MKILHVIPSYVPAYRYGGPVKGTHELCKALSRRGLGISVFTTNADYDRNLNVTVNEEQNIDGVNVTYYPVKFMRPYFYSRELGEAVKTQISKFDIVHIHSVFLYPTYIGARWCRKKNIPYIINPFGALDPDMIKLKNTIVKKTYIKIVEQYNIKKAKAIHLSSLYEKKQFLSLGFNVPTSVIPRGLDIGDYLLDKPSDCLIEQNPELRGKRLILFLGRIHPKKGLDLLANAFAKVIEKKSDIHLVIAGPGEEDHVDKARKLFKRMKLLDNVLFTGMLLNENKLSAFYKSSAFVLPSYGENFGITVLEAMACRLPVVLTKRVGLYPDVEEYGAGIVTDCDSVQIADAILRILDNKTLATSMAENARRLVEDRFTWDIVADKTIALYKSLLPNCH